MLRLEHRSGAMGVLPVLLLPVAVSDQAGCPLHHPWGQMLLLWTALLFLGESGFGTRGRDGPGATSVCRLELCSAKMRLV